MGRGSRASAVSFSSEVVGQLKWYVYRLYDPRTGETFYVGKGKGNRLFAHMRAEADYRGDAVGDKLQRIRSIRLSGFEVGHVVHRHGMDEQTALEVEAALIDAYPGLTNIVSGIGRDERGAMHALEITKKYAAEEAEIRHKAILISVNKSAVDRANLLEATRWAWKINPRKARQAEVVLPTMRGLIVGAFVADRWLEATAANFPGYGDNPGRYGFVGRDAPPEIARLYQDKRVPVRFRKRGAANPIKYTW